MDTLKKLMEKPKSVFLGKDLHHCVVKLWFYLEIFSDPSSSFEFNNRKIND